MNTLSKFIADNFSADIIHKRDGSILSFNREKFNSYDEIYNHQAEGLFAREIKIEVKLADSEKNNDNGDDGDGVTAVTVLEGAFHSLKDENENNNAHTNALTPSLRIKMIAH